MTTEQILNRIKELEDALFNPSTTLDDLGISNELPQELKDLREKYFNYYTMKNLHIIQASNNNQEELQYFKNLIMNKDVIHNTLKKYNVCASPNGYFYRKDIESVYAKLLGGIYANRKIEQKLAKEFEEKIKNGDTSDETKSAFEYHDLMQKSVLKILLNSSYGSTALEYNPFSHGKGMSASITTTGRFANRMVAYNINKKIVSILGIEKNVEEVPYTIQADTDSNYIHVDPIIKTKNIKINSVKEGIEVCTKLSEKLFEPTIQETIDTINYVLNAYNPNVLVMEQETIAEKFISVADKRYFCQYYKEKTKDGEKYLKKEHKVTGLSLIGKSTPKFCKKALEPVLSLVAEKELKDIVNYAEEIKKEFTKQELKDICVIKGLSNISYFQEGDKYYRYNPETGKKVPAPMHSRGSIVHNKLLDENNDSEFVRIIPGDKVYIAPLLLPNPLKQNVVCFTNPKFMKKYDLEKYVDYDTLFEKNFKKNIELITIPSGMGELNAFTGMLDEWE